MEQFRQIGEVLGSIKALMVFRDEIRINQRQCVLLADAFNFAFESISGDIRQHLRFDEKLTKWKALEQPLKELHRIFREGEHYIRQCLEPRDWWGRALALSQSTECVEFHLHNLLWCIPIVLEAIEAASEISSCDQDEIHRKRVFFSKKYEREWMDPMLFQHNYGKLYLASQDLCRRMEGVFREDRWVFSEMIAKKRSSSGLKPMTKQENRLAELLVGPKERLHPSSVLMGSPDYQVRRRLGTGANCKEIQWMGESFALKHVFKESEQLTNEISLLLSVDHPNVMNYMYAFAEEEKKESFLVMELMSKDLSSYIKEVTSTRKRVPFPILLAVDVMLQIARGMEYLHSRMIYHGELNPSNILVKARNSSSSDGYLHVKVTNFGLSPVVKNSKTSATQVAAAATNPCIWYAPEVLSDQEQAAESSNSKYTGKADVYSFAMICFELLTGKIPFEESHLQGDKMSRNIRAGERPLFPCPFPKYLANLTKRCWHADPLQRPSFSSICRMLRYIKRFLIMNPDHSQPDLPAPQVDYFDIEMSLSKKFESWGSKEALQISEIPFQMFAYRVIERERTSLNLKDKSSESESDSTSVCGDENGFNAIALEDSLSSSAGSVRPLAQVGSNGNKKTLAKKVDGKANKQIGQHQKVRTVKPSQLTTCGRSLRNSANQLRPVVMSPGTRRTAGNVSD